MGLGTGIDHLNWLDLGGYCVGLYLSKKETLDIRKVTWLAHLTILLVLNRCLLWSSVAS